MQGRVMTRGYVLVTMPDGSRCREHRLVMESVLGRPLLNSEVVHHINGDRKDNRPENLMVMTQEEHIKLHRPGRVAFCHPDRNHHGRGMCALCYQDWLNNHLRTMDEDRYLANRRLYVQRYRQRHPEKYREQHTRDNERATAKRRAAKKEASHA